MASSKKMAFSPDVVRKLADKYRYTEVEVRSEQDRGHLLMFKHPGMRGCGGSDKEVGEFLGQ